ncbi:YaeQ family protein [Pokkaliibacter sp. MBI-7]|uniref:YaeQ family protein n=1 Tax=Proteobacteria bacterium 228 TaxID=2083153 RepID=A0A2S5KPL9_9PROT|nr:MULTISPECIES: YaeQ family protein [Pokkaliibacter]MDH2434872.1 YaeQ family protein [Pokkaliibacter sp. MBI-7]PPC76623.1 hypothetical protein C4K68_14445 [Pokkaliibacter plantistimulans]
MALKATVFKSELNVSDMDRHHYQSYSLTLARHPSETDERMMVRLLAFALQADEQLEFCKGLSNDEEPDLWQKQLTGDIETWIEVGLPDERRLRKASSRARRVVVYCYGGRNAGLWWKGIEDKLQRFDNVEVYNLPEEATQLLAEQTARTMDWQCMIQDGQVWMNSSASSIQVDLERLK